MAKFGTFKFNEELFGGEAPGGGPGGGGYITGTLVRVPWIFTELNTGDEYEFAINPLDATMPAVEKNITTQYTATGKPVNFEGRPPVQKISFSGTILTQAHLEAMRLWAKKKKQVTLMDDLTQRYSIVMESFVPTRNYNPQYPWRHEFTASATVLSWE